MDIEEFIKKYKYILKISKVEKKIGMPRLTLQKCVKNKNKLIPKKWIIPLKSFLIELKNNINKIQ